MSRRSQIIRAAFDEVADLAPADRATWLDKRCADDADLRAEVEALLAHEGDAVLDRPFVDVGERDALQPGASIAGRYRLERVLGRGGMGIVWLAQQEQPRRAVALKLIGAGVIGAEVLRRFERESAVLGRLSHPGIAQIHDAGTFDDGSGARPYFAMELVEGRSLTDASAGLDAHERLDLFARICDAVEHAHQKGVIHRDLKPANILVTPAGQPKILDFGVARVTDADVQATTLHTAVGQVVGTLAYMSPEQVEGATDRLDTRSDVYALGVLLYELLCGRVPHDLTDMSIAQAARCITESDPVPLSSVDRALRGDLETITSKALEADPERRYGTAAALSADLRRFLRDEPIEARRASTAYQLQKFTRRNRVLVTGMAATLLALFAGLVGTSVNMVRARRAASQATAMNEFLTDVLSAADVDEGAASLLLVDALRQASDRAAIQFADHPELEADTRHLLGTIFWKFSLHREAADHLDRAVALRCELLGPGHLRTRESRLLAMTSHQTLMHLDEAESHAQEILAHTRSFERDTAMALSAERVLATILTLRGDEAAAEAALHDIFDRSRAALGPEHSATLLVATQLARQLRRRVMQRRSDDSSRELDEATALYEEVVALRTRLDGADARVTLVPMTDLVDCLRLQGDLTAAADLAESVVERATARYGPDHGIVTFGLAALSEVRADQGRTTDAADRRIDAVSATARRAGGDSIAVLVGMGDALPLIADVAYDDVERARIGLEYAQRLFDRFAARGRHSDAAVEARLYLTSFLTQLGELDAAQAHFDELIGGEADLAGWLRSRLDGAYGEYLAARGWRTEAEARLTSALDQLPDGQARRWPVARIRGVSDRLNERQDAP